MKVYLSLYKYLARARKKAYLRLKIFKSSAFWIVELKKFTPHIPILEKRKFDFINYVLKQKL